VDNIGQSVSAQDLSLAGLPNSAISAEFGRITLPRRSGNPGFRGQKIALRIALLQGLRIGLRTP
jgi:hypothetical protein